MRTPHLLWLFFIPFFMFLFGIDLLVSGQCLSDQQSLLLQFSNSIRFSSTLSVKLVKWNQSTDCCQWDGVECDGGRVIGLDLSNESISGRIDDSSTLFSLQYLQSLNLAFNSFNNSQVPSNFDKLANLSNLNLSNAGFMGQIPIEISKLTRLVTLDLSTLYFTGMTALKLENPDLMMLVQNLSELTELYLDGVNISAQGNEWCRALSSSLPNLEALSMSNCYLSGPIESSLAKIQSLSIIRLDGNNLSAAVPKFFANYSNLTTLRLSSTGLYGIFPEEILQVPTLQTLDLSNNQLLEGFLPAFPRDASLHTLVLSHTTFQGELPVTIGNLARLSRIELAGCNFNGSIPNTLANLTQLVYVDFSSNNFTGPVPSFSSSRNLTQLILAHNLLNDSINSTNWEVLSDLVNLDLRNNSLSGEIPSSLFRIPSLQRVQLPHNQFTGQLKEFPKVSSSQLDTLDLASNKLEGPFPMSVFGLQNLKILTLSFNNFSGSVPLSEIQQLRNLSSLDLSYNSLSIDATDNDSTSSSFPHITTLKLASCNLTKFPDFLKNQSKLVYLDLSDNHIDGQIPSWIWQTVHLFHLNLSRNLLKKVEDPSQGVTTTLSVVDLHANQLQGQLPVLPLFATYLDYSSNNFSSVMPATIGDSLTVIYFFSLSGNNFHGSIPESICKATYLQVLDLSNNSLSGPIPQCLTVMSTTLGVLNLRRNKFNGAIADKFPGNCSLQTLDLSGNSLEGKVPESLANCKMLEVLNLGNNQVSDIFPFHLKNISRLRVLVLRSNKFYGPIGCCLENNTPWEKLQIVDLAFNNFTGELPQKCLKTWAAMMDDGNVGHNHLRFDVLQFNGFYYQDAITVTSKGLEMELVKILTVFTSIDLSCNKFEGPIPDVIGKFKALYVLNLSHNALTGHIPSSIGNLSQLESLDLSSNHLNGTIPMQLASLTFLSFFNLSYNQLEGRIPIGSQLQTFAEDSYEGNTGLCGFPLPENCTDYDEPPSGAPSNTSNEFDWQFIFTGLGFGLGAGAVVAPIMFSKKANKWYDEGVDKVLKVIFPMLGLVYTRWDDVKVEPEESFDDSEEDHGDDDDDDHGDDGNANEEFGGRYCVFCSKLDITRKKAIHDPKCMCFSPTASSSSSPSSSSSSLVPLDRT